MKNIATFARLAGMRRSAGGSLLVSLQWAAGLLWRNHLAGRRATCAQRSADVQHASCSQPCLAQQRSPLP